MKSRLARTLSLIAALSASAGLKAQSTIDARSAPGFCCSGVGGSFIDTYGQSFTIVQAGLTVIDFNFWIWKNPFQGGPDLTFQTILASIQPDGSFGSAFFTSAPTIANPFAPQWFNFTTGLQAPLAPGRYVAIVKGLTGLPMIPLAMTTSGSGSTYAGGEILGRDGSNPTGPWVPATFYGGDTEFYATLGQATVTPEPASLVLVASGLAGVAGFVRRRRRRNDT